MAGMAVRTNEQPRTGLCPRCHARVDAASRFCERCGRSLIPEIDVGGDETMAADLSIMVTEDEPTEAEHPSATPDNPGPERWGRFSSIGVAAPTGIATPESPMGWAGQHEDDAHPAAEPAHAAPLAEIDPTAGNLDARRHRSLVGGLLAIVAVLALLLVAVWAITDRPDQITNGASPSSSEERSSPSTTRASLPPLGPATPASAAPEPTNAPSSSVDAPPVVPAAAPIRATPTYRTHRDPATGACLAVPDFMRDDPGASTDPAPALRDRSTDVAAFVSEDRAVWLDYQNEAATSAADLQNQYERALAFLPAEQRTVAAPRNLHGGYSVSGRRDGLGYYISGVYVPSAQKIATFRLIWKPSADPALTAANGVTEAVFRQFPGCA